MARARLEILLVVLWSVALGLALWVMSLEPEVSLLVIIVFLAVTMIGLGRYLQFRKKRRR